jgi:hypothetical protein
VLTSLNRSYDECPDIEEFIDASDDPDAWVDRYDAILLPVRAKLQAKLSEVAPLETDVDHLKKRGILIDYSLSFSYSGAYQSIMLCKIARYWNPSLIEVTYR